MPLTEAQRKAILERDEHQSQMRHYSEEKGWFTIPDDGSGLHVHHIKPQRIGGEDVPENLITLNRSEHIGVMAHGLLANPLLQFVVHPDMIEAFARYREGVKDAFKMVFSARDELLDQGYLYHNPDHDDEMTETAIQRTLNAVCKGWKFPHRS